MIKPDSLFRRLAGIFPNVPLSLAILPLAAFCKANYATPCTFTPLAGSGGRFWHYFWVGANYYSASTNSSLGAQFHHTNVR